MFPFFWTLLSSLKSANEAIAVPPSLAASKLALGQLRRAISVVSIWSLLLEHVFGSYSSAFSLPCCSARWLHTVLRGFPFLVAGFLFALVVLQFMVPPTVFIYPQYRMLYNLNALNSLFALIFPGLVSAFGTFLMRQAFLSLPSSLEEASVIDGCNRCQIYAFVYMPLLKSFIVALSIFTMIFAWKDLMWPLIVNTDIKKMTLSAGMMYLQTGIENIPNYGVVMAGAIVATVPLILLYMLFQKHFQLGIAMTGIK